MSATVHPMRPAEPFDRRAIADGLDEARNLVEAAGMAAADFDPDSRRTALRTLLAVIDDKLRAPSGAVLPGGGA